MRSPERIELAEDVVQEEQGWPAVELREEVQLGELEGKDRGPLLPARSEPGEIAAGQVERNVVAMRPDHRRAVPYLLVGRVDQPPGECVARRLAGEHRGVGH